MFFKRRTCSLRVQDTSKEHVYGTFKALFVSRFSLNGIRCLYSRVLHIYILSIYLVYMDTWISCLRVVDVSSWPGPSIRGSTNIKRALCYHPSKSLRRTMLFLALAVLARAVFHGQVFEFFVRLSRRGVFSSPATNAATFVF